MKIIKNYILNECVAPFIMALLVLTCVFLLGYLIPLTNMVINKGVNITSIGQAFSFTIPVFLGYTIPLACLISVIVAFSRFSTDNEIIAMRANGIPLKKLLTPLLFLGIIASLFMLILNERVIPYAHHEQRKAFKNLGATNPTAFLEAGKFISSFTNQIIFIHKIDGNKLSTVTIWQPKPDGPTRTIIAKHGEFTPVPGENKLKLKLMDGTSDEPDMRNSDTFYKLNFKNYFMTLDLSKNEKTVDKKPQSMTFKELKSEITKLERLFVDTTRLRTEYHRKITWSFSPFIFILLAFPLAVITNKREKSANVVLALMCFAFYYLLSLGCGALSEQNIAPPAITMWMPNIITTLGALILNYKCVS